ncbi:hypothetical protein [Bradyrhizobium sp. STM 3562]|uniref:hypothetical protein n=1 Tax=Bradyrhizobium sp. STM 3562 TaxID=578924 RepID=UPI00388F4029
MSETNRAPDAPRLCAVKFHELNMPPERADRLAEQHAMRVEAISTLRRLRREARDEICRLIRFLDESDPYVMTELEDDDSSLFEEGGDSEPSLGSFDRMINQEKSYTQRMKWATFDHDLEEDDCDQEDDDPRELDDTGIGDMDGLLEQVGNLDWQAGGIV